MKKLMIVTPYFYPKIGGLENYAYNIAKGLKKYGWEIVVVTSNHESKEYKEEILDGIKIYRLPRQFKVSNTPVSFKWKKQIKEIIQREKPDVINTHTPVPFISDVTARIAYKLKIPFVLTYHNDLSKDNLFLDLICKLYYRFLGNKSLDLSNKIIATSKYYAKNSPYLKKRSKKIKIVSPGINLSQIESFKKIKNQILFVGQLDKTHAHKGLNYLIDSMNIVKNEIKDVKLFIIGKGDNLKHYKEYINQLGLQNNIILTGFVSDKELNNYYTNSEVIVLSTSNNSEGFGMTLIEGMAHKCVSIGTKVGGIPYVIDDGKNGLLVPPKDPKALADAIIKILNNAKLAEQMGENGYKKVKENFTWDIQIKKTDEMLKEISR